MTNKGIQSSKLIPGKLYILRGNPSTNSGAWPAYLNRPELNKTSKLIPLYPLEPFVFLERLLSDYRYSDTDPMYDYKILTCNGVLCWLSLHDDDLKVLGIYFREYRIEDFEENL